MDDLVTLKFVNREYDGDHGTDEMRVSRTCAHRVATWYGGYHAGDDYDVLIDGEIVGKNINGEIAPA